MHSRDGLTWHRFADRSPVIARGPRGSYDAGCILCSADRPVVHGDEVWHYYTGINTMHGGPLPPKQCVIGRVSWRLDGFVSLDAGAFEGCVRTVPLAGGGRRLEVNADAGAGSVAVAVLAADGTTLDGFGAADCKPAARRRSTPRRALERRRPPAGRAAGTAAVQPEGRGPVQLPPAGVK